MRLLAVLPFLALACATPCVPLDGDRILAADLASELPEFNRLDPQTVLGLAPVPGTQRTFAGREIAALAQRNGIPLEASARKVCFERRLQGLTGEQILTALRSSLGSDEARIDIVDFTRQPMPAGELVFPRSGLTPPRSEARPAVWRGSVRYSAGHTLPVWATVRIQEERDLVIAARPIRRGAPILPEDVTLIRRSIFPFTPHLETQERAVGRIARRTIPVGALIPEELLEIPADIAAGDTVHVVVRDGAARIRFDAVATTPGRKGDRIVLQNPESRRSFRAWVDGKASAHVGGDS